MVTEIVSEFISTRSLLRKDAPVIVALSGGADSVALLAILTELGYDCVAAHCNFHLRGDESVRDMRHALSVADTLGVEISVRDFDVEGRRRETGESVEMACRSLRYEWFETLADRHGAQAIAVGHHREDRAETFFLNLMRGAGIHGLTAMRPRNGDVVRPLLCLSRPQIEDYLRERGLLWVDDSTNASCDYRRNVIRNKVFPALAQAFPNPADATAESMEHLDQALRIYQEAVDGILRSCRISEYEFDLAAVSARPYAATLLWEALSPYGFSYGQVRDILCAPEASGRSFIAKGGEYTAATHRGVLRISSKVKGSPREHGVTLARDIVSPIYIRVNRHPVEAFAPVADPGFAFFDDSFVISGTWTLRHPGRGDRIRVFGSGNSVLVSKILKDNGVPADKRSDIWLLCRDGEPMWIPGIRNAAGGAISPETRNYIELQYIHDI